MSCPLHPMAPVTTRTVPVEIYPAGGTPPPFRVPAAVRETCSQCGACYYDWVAVAKLPVQALGQSQAPTYPADDC